MSKHFTVSFRNASVLLFLSLGIIVSCSKKSDDPVNPANPLVSTAPDKGFSSQVIQIITQPILDSLKKKGMIINEGVQPPQVSNTYYLDPNILVAPYGKDDSYKAGDKFLSYWYKFYEQDASGNIKYDFLSKYTAAYEYDKGKGIGSVISGFGNKFTIFSQQNGVTTKVIGQETVAIPNKQLTVISGELTSTGDIKNWQNAFYLVDKTGDTDNKGIVKIGSTRVFKDGDDVAIKYTSFVNWPARKGVSEEILPTMISN